MQKQFQASIDVDANTPIVDCLTFLQEHNVKIHNFDARRSTGSNPCVTLRADEKDSMMELLKHHHYPQTMPASMKSMNPHSINPTAGDPNESWLNTMISEVRMLKHDED